MEGVHRRLNTDDQIFFIVWLVEWGVLSNWMSI